MVDQKGGSWLEIDPSCCYRKHSSWAALHPLLFCKVCLVRVQMGKMKTALTPGAEGLLHKGRRLTEHTLDTCQLKRVKAAAARLCLSSCSKPCHCKQRILRIRNKKRNVLHSPLFDALRPSGPPPSKHRAAGGVTPGLQTITTASLLVTLLLVHIVHVPEAKCLSRQLLWCSTMQCHM